MINNNRVYLKILLILFISVKIYPQYNIDSLTKIVNSIYKLPNRTTPPASLTGRKCIRDGKEFNPQEYFKLFKHIKMKSGYKLDFMYNCGRNGFPVLFAKDELCEKECFKNSKQKLKGLNIKNTHLQHNLYLTKIKKDTTDLAYIEAAILVILGDQFYLQWHAKYNDDKIIFSKEYLNKEYLFGGWNGEIDIPSEFFLKANLLDLHPNVITTDSTKNVHIMTFTKWGGLTEMKIIFNKNEELILSDIKSSVKVPYNCGIKF